MLPVQNVAAGSSGSGYRAVLSFLAKGTGNYVINDTNFAGIGRYLPCVVMIASGTPANVSVSMSTDNGTTWKVGPTGGGLVYADAGGVTGSPGGVSTTQSVRINIQTGATDIFLYPLAAS